MPKYDPTVFDVNNMQEAKEIILVDRGMKTDERWELETPFIADKILSLIKIKQDSLVLDFVCGLGRMSRALIERTNCYVLGVDISSSMRQMSVEYVGSDKFSVISGQVFEKLVLSGLQVDMAISIWVLQHCPGVEKLVQLIHQCIKPQGPFFVASTTQRCVPTDKGWVSDGINEHELMLNYFNQISDFSKLTAEVASPVEIDTTYLTCYQKK